MSKFMDDIEAVVTGKCRAGRPKPPAMMDVEVSVSEPVAFDRMLEYKVYLKYGRMVFTLPENLEYVKKDIVDSFRYHLYKDLHEHLREAYMAMHEQDLDAVKEALDKIDKEIR